MRPLSIATLALLSACHVDVIPDRDLTYTAISETFFRIHLYAKANGSLPSSLLGLPVRAGYANRTMDAWERPLQYEISDTGVLTVRSLGKDGSTGGNGEDEDIIVRYRGRDEAGKVIAGHDMWIVDGELASEPQQGVPADVPRPAGERPG
jgi:Type II secretion system (T2SS), protein G